MCWQTVQHYRSGLWADTQVEAEVLTIIKWLILSPLNTSNLDPIHSRYLGPAISTKKLGGVTCLVAYLSVATWRNEIVGGNRVGGGFCPIRVGKTGVVEQHMDIIHCRTYHMFCKAILGQRVRCSKLMNYPSIPSDSKLLLINAIGKSCCSPGSFPSITIPDSPLVSKL